MASSRTHRATPLVPLAIAALTLLPVKARSGPQAAPRAPKVLVITPTSAEASPWVMAFGLSTQVPAPGLLSPVLCNADDVCLVVTGQGKANATASVAALVFSPAFDLSSSYFLVAGVAGIDPAEGTLGSVAWATTIVDYAISWEIDARTLPSGWTTGYLGVGAMSPAVKPPSAFSYGTEIFTLSSALVAKGAALSNAATLADDAAAMAARAAYASMPGASSPSILSCDTVSSDTKWRGALLGDRARSWTTLMTGGQGTYCTTQASDNAVLEALERGADAGLLDAKRIAVVHAASTFDRPPAGQPASAALQPASAAVETLAVQNLAAAGGAVVTAIVSGWSSWQSGVPR